MTPLELGAVLLQFSFFLVGGLPIGRALGRWFDDVSRREEDGPMRFLEHRLGAPERILLTLTGAVAWATVLMIVHIATRGAVFGTPGIVPAATLGLLVVERRRSLRAPDAGRGGLQVIVKRHAVPIAIGAFLLIGIYVLPMILAGSSVRSGDSPWHLGWTEQILAGEPVPAGPAPRFAYNAYPWGVHAVLATMVRLVPGTTPLVALAALHLVVVAGLPLAAACVARRILPSAGWAAAGAMTLIGGLGWMVAGGPEFSTSPSGGRAGADLVVASPNAVYEALPPALPRELGLILLGTAGCALLLAGVNRRAAVAAGAIAGLVGLVSVPMFVSALVWMLAIGWTAGSGKRIRAAAAFVLPALVVFALWAGPVIVNYVRFDGFVDVTPRLGREWSLAAALASWGLLLPLALIGAVVCLRQQRARAEQVLALAFGTVLLLGLATARGGLDWDLYGNATLLHQGRVWPPAHLLAAVFGGVALVTTWGVLSARIGRWRFLVAAGATVIALGSPVLASIALTEEMVEGGSGFIYDEADLVEAQRFVQRAAASLGPDDVVAVEGSDELAFLLFQFSGVRLVGYDNPNLDRNDLRIRYKEPAERWQRIADADGFSVSHRVLRVAGGPAQPSGVVAGSFEGETWVLVEENDV